MSRPRILVFAYACEPDKGSEPGAGWMWARMLARIGDTCVITRANNRLPIESALPSLPERDSLRFVYVDPSKRVGFFKREQRGVRLYYLMWQVTARRAARAMHRRHAFDIVWHVTLANAWLGSLAPLTGARFVLGPVGGGVRVPPRSWPALGVRGTVYEVARTAARAVGRYVNPLARRAWSRADLILTQNPETRAWFPSRHRSRTRVFPNVVLEMSGPSSARERSDTPVALFAGRLLAWKGLSLSLRALTYAPRWRLRIIGEGPDRARLQRLATRLGVIDRVTFKGWVTRSALLEVMKEADLFLIPSLHEDASMAIAEAMSQGLPAICLDRGGPPLIGRQGAVVIPSAGGVRALARALAASLESSDNLPRPEQVASAAQAWTLDARTEALRAVLEDSIGSDGPG